MNETIFKQRTKTLGLRVIRLVESLPSNRVADVIGRQLLRAGTSVGANYRAACRARSTDEIIARLGDVEEEADEIGFWLEMLVEGGVIRQRLVADLMDKTNQILSMVVASIKGSPPPIQNRQSKIQNP